MTEFRAPMKRFPLLLLTCLLGLMLPATQAAEVNVRMDLSHRHHHHHHHHRHHHHHHHHVHVSVRL